MIIQIKKDNTCSRENWSNLKKYLDNNLFDYDELISKQVIFKIKKKELSKR